MSEENNPSILLSIFIKSRKILLYSIIVSFVTFISLFILIVFIDIEEQGLYIGLIVVMSIFLLEFLVYIIGDMLRIRNANKKTI
jgi:hypothetical protein